MENKNKMQEGSFDPRKKGASTQGGNGLLRSREGPGPFDWARQ